MQLTRLIYASRASQRLQHDEVMGLLDQARTANVNRGITGVLYFNRRYFLQLIEGEREEINRLFRSLIADPRHELVTILDYEEIDHREFSQWSMGFVPESSLSRDVLMRFSARGQFEPFDLGARGSHELVTALGECLERSREAAA